MPSPRKRTQFVIELPPGMCVMLDKELERLEVTLSAYIVAVLTKHFLNDDVILTKRDNRTKHTMRKKIIQKD